MDTDPLLPALQHPRNRRGLASKTCIDNGSNVVITNGFILLWKQDLKQNTLDGKPATLGS